MKVKIENLDREEGYYLEVETQNGGVEISVKHPDNTRRSSATRLTTAEARTLAGVLNSVTTTSE